MNTEQKYTIEDLIRLSDYCTKLEQQNKALLRKIDSLERDLKKQTIDKQPLD